MVDIVWKVIVESCCVVCPFNVEIDSSNELIYLGIRKKLGLKLGLKLYSCNIFMWPNEIKKVYIICHSIKEKTRYERLVCHLEEVGIPTHVVKFMAPVWSDELSCEQIFSVYDPFLVRCVPGLTFKGRGLSKGEISLALNFYACVQDAVACGYSKIITLESDIWLRADFVSRLCDLLADVTERAWDYISLGEGVGTRPDADKSYYAPTKGYSPPHQFVYRCTDSMMFTLPFLQKLEKTFIPFREIIDWEMNYQNLLHGAVALWADPPLAEQGTCYSRLTSSLPA